MAGALAVTLHAVTGITNKSLRALMPGLLGQGYTMNRASYDLTGLRRNGLITRVPSAGVPDGRGGLVVLDHLDPAAGRPEGRLPRGQGRHPVQGGLITCLYTSIRYDGINYSE